MALGGQLGRVRASGVPVLALEQDPKAATDQVIAELPKPHVKTASNPSFWAAAAWLIFSKEAQLT